MNLNFNEKLIALFYFIQRKQFLIPPKCFCNKIFQSHILKKSSKRKHKSQRFLLEIFLDFVLNKIFYIKTLFHEKKINTILIKQFCMHLNKNEIDFFIQNFLNKNFTLKLLKRKKKKFLIKLFKLLKKNPVTTFYFQKNIFIQNCNNLIELFKIKRKNKIKKFLNKFENKSFKETYFLTTSLLKKKRVKLFFSNKDLNLALLTIFKLI